MSSMAWASIAFPLATGGVRSAIEAVPLVAWQLLLTTGILVSVIVLYRTARPHGQWGQRLRSRLVLGLPWGTLLGLAFVVCVYLFVQGGLGNLRDPVSLPFQATSYAYPLGVLTAGFAHVSWGHLVGNLWAGLVFGSIAEYAWSHYPAERGSASFASWSSNPFVRVAIFFTTMLLAGLLTAAFSWGPIIGFSGVTYALAGFALVFYPVSTIVAVAGWTRLRHVYTAFASPYSIAEASVSYDSVWWASTAVQGHVFGFLLGVFVAALVVRFRGTTTNPARIWLAAMIYGIANGLWRVYWFLGDGQYVQFKAVGTTLVFVLAGLIVALVAGSDRSAFASLPQVDRLVDPTPRWQIAASVLLAVLVTMSIVGATLNLVAPAGGGLPDDAVEVNDYEIAYAENVTNRQIAVLDLPFLEQVTQVQTSGVIVTSEKRHLWRRAISKRALEARGSGRVLVGGVGWRTSVWATRSGWSVVGGNSTYRVFLDPDGDEKRLVHTSTPAVADLRLANRTIAIRPAADAFEVAVRRGNQTLGTVAVPGNGGNATVGGVRFDRTGRDLYASIDGTRIRVANRQVPPTRQ
ncbi:Rhomboid family protein [Halorhabdus tiamatea SARL4B]|uniref:Rhomboid family protein n=1 Tax=Halorhabdus tiamatea SARL4B TaxID=1033806 RepID=S6CVV4_9EURY|nr:rhomboid family intramembrane serine protease [Halorhabdus tiamatea]ERJ06995.1 Rhomboid family protein [Halorhabdus tiamatea SARL4B]CCQ34767.1 rhomboid family protein [Halorhabdus tiamatea SARL4B]